MENTILKPNQSRPTNPSERMSNFELLRIISMLMIVAHHFSVHGGFAFGTDVISITKLWVQFIQMGGKIGVDIFVLISGYFLISSSKIKFSKIIKLWLQLATYSVGIYLVFVLCGRQPFSMKEAIKCFLPVRGGWWFASTYFILYILSPFINKFLCSIDKKTYQKLLILLTTIWCLAPTFTGGGGTRVTVCCGLCIYTLLPHISNFGTISPCCPVGSII